MGAPLSEKRKSSVQRVAIEGIKAILDVGEGTQWIVRRRDGNVSWFINGKKEGISMERLRPQKKGAAIFLKGKRAVLIARVLAPKKQKKTLKRAPFLQKARVAATGPARKNIRAASEKNALLKNC